MALKKAPANAENKVKEVTKATFQKMLKSKKKVFDRSKKKDSPVGFVKDEEVIKAFALRPGSGVTAKARMVSAKVVEMQGDLIVKFKFVVQDGENQGMPLQQDIWLHMEDDEKLEKDFDSVVFMLQKLGYETDDLDISDIYDLCDELTQEKPYCVIYINCYALKHGKNKGTKKYGVRVNSPYKPEDTEKEEDEDDETSDEDEEEDSEDEDSDDSEESESDSEDEDEGDSEADEDEADEEEESDEPDEDDPSTWIGYDVVAKPKGKKTSATYTISAYSEKTEMLSAKTSDGKTIKFSPEEVSDWA